MLLTNHNTSKPTVSLPMDDGNSSRKRKADSLTRLSLGNSIGRGSQAGWTLCPLCGRHSNKRFALGRGIATHLHAVHTPWNPGKVERKKRRRLRELRQTQFLEKDDQHEETTRDAPWTPTEEEINCWNEKVLSIVKELEVGATKQDAAGTIGRDRAGNEAKCYRESLPEFIQAAANGDYVKLKSMVEKSNKNGELEQLLSTRDRHQSLAEHWAAGGGHLDCLRFLCNQRTNLQQEDTSSVLNPRKIRRRDGKSCLHYAARNGKLDCVKYLVEEQQCEIDEVAGDGTTPLHLACFGGHQNVVEYLVDHGGNIHQINEWGCSAAHWVAMTRNQSTEDVRRLCVFLKQRGLSFVARQKQGHTPLHKAAQRGNRHVISWMAESADSGGAGLSKAERESAGTEDDGNHTPVEIWRNSGGDEAFAARMKQWGW